MPGVGLLAHTCTACKAALQRCTWLRAHPFVPSRMSIKRIMARADACSRTLPRVGTHGSPDGHALAARMRLTVLTIAPLILPCRILCSRVKSKKGCDWTRAPAARPRGSPRILPVLHQASCSVGTDVLTFPCALFQSLLRACEPNAGSGPFERRRAGRARRHGGQGRSRAYGRRGLDGSCRPPPSWRKVGAT